MKTKRILSMLLATVMISLTVIAALPTLAFASRSAGEETGVYNPNIYSMDTAGSIQQRNEMTYASAFAMWNKELNEGQLMSVESKDGMYSIYVNVYTGFMYYKNVNNQVLMSNFYNYSDSKLDSVTPDMLSQIEIEYSEIKGSSEPKTTYSYTDAARLNQIYVSKIQNGIRVNYTLGDTKLRYIVPGALSQENYLYEIIIPVLKAYLDDATWSGVKNVFKNDLESYKKGGKTSDLFEFAARAMMGPNYVPVESTKANTEFVKSGALERFNTYFTNYKELFDLEKEFYLCREHGRSNKAVCTTCGSALEKTNAVQVLFFDSNGKINITALQYYVRLIESMGNTDTDYTNIGKPLDTILLGQYAFSQDGTYIVCNIPTGKYEDFEVAEDIIEKYCDYGFNDMYRDEQKFGYVYKHVSRPVFRCALEYTFNEDGSLCVSLPANSIAFDESTYILRSITPLKYFGAATLDIVNEKGNRDGYIFYPDGSGAVISFNDFETVDIFAPIYGIDHAYSDIETLTGDYREQITMPVYGAVFTEDAEENLSGTKSFNNGYFAIIEEGAPLAKLSVNIKNSGTKGYAVVFPSYQPYPSDTYDLSKTLSVSSLSEYTMVSATKFSGTYTTRITMLSDERLVAKNPGITKVASYEGMAEVYREYLEKSGAISAIANVGNALPLYIEAFGSLEVTKKILSFPVEVSEALTTFEDVKTMYRELADAKAKIAAKAAEYEALSQGEEKDLELRALYQAKAEEYRQLSAKIDNITNINFRLTGFANGGMKSTYPSKLKWDKVVGGKRGFKDLLEYASSVSATAGSNLGIYPDFDFLYITNTAMFDGIYPNGISSKLIDNRYAEKQLYNSVAHMYEASMIKLVSADSLDELYEKFNKDYKKYDVGAISVSTLGSDINSNFDDEEPVNRDEARQYISSLLGKMKGDGYKIMVNKGNSYTYEYASHIVDAYVDSSHLRYASYTVPFFGMTLHGYISYAGNAINYSGDPQYDILRSIENGASLYYILCYQNTSKMKDDVDLNGYYGVDYATWFEKVVEHYHTVNEAIGGELQTYKLVSHRILTVERVVDDSEREKIYSQLVDELVEYVEAKLDEKVIEAYKAMSAVGEYNRGISFDIDEAAILSEVEEIFNLNDVHRLTAEQAETVKSEITARLSALEAAFGEEYKAQYGDNANPYAVVFNTLGDYSSMYDYVTDSVATDGDNYDKTSYTVNNYNVVMVTYQSQDGTKTVDFVLNYNIYDVIVNLGDGESFVLGKYEYKKLG